MSRPSGEVKVDKKRIDQGGVEFGRNIILAIGELFRKLTFREVDLVSWNFQETISFCSGGIVNKFDRFRDLALEIGQRVLHCGVPYVRESRSLQRLHLGKWVQSVRS